MKQLIQSLHTGDVEVADIPRPSTRPGHCLIKTSYSLISAGTERMLLDFGKGNLLSKARQQPDKVRQVLSKIKTDGLLQTLDAVKTKLNQPIAPGYCNVGTVIEVGRGVTGFKPGDRVLNNGPHADFVCVPQNLCAGIPNGLDDKTAVYGVLAAIGMQGVRLAQPTLGECFAVTGLGLIGLLTTQILLANGCRVLGMDFDTTKCDIAAAYGAEAINLSTGEDPISKAAAFSRGRGVDGVLITAATNSDEPVKQAATISRQRGRIILVGVTGLTLSRDDFYKKELTFQVSCSYGPGRYDPEYENKGHDYPLGHVRWTEQRNFEAVLDLMKAGKLTADQLTTHSFSIDKAQKAYDLIAGKQEPYIGIQLEYANREQAEERTLVLSAKPTGVLADKPVIGFIGAGNYASRVLMPAANGLARLKTVVTASGFSGTAAGKANGFEQSTTDVEVLLTDPDIDAIFIATRHNSHASLVIKGLEAGKHVFVEKPLCLASSELEKIKTTWQAHPDLRLMVGFNRRFAPQIATMKTMLQGIAGARQLIATVNAGGLPADHWLNDPEVGGGRIIGEACHFIDLLRYLADSPIIDIVSTISPDNEACTISLAFEDGSIGAVNYVTVGSNDFPKERIEVFGDGKVLQLNNFKTLTGWGWSGFTKTNRLKQSKGQKEAVAAFLSAVETGGDAPIPISEIFETAEATCKAASGKAGGRK